MRESDAQQPKLHPRRIVNVERALDYKWGAGGGGGRTRPAAKQAREKASRTESVAGVFDPPQLFVICLRQLIPRAVVWVSDRAPHLRVNNWFCRKEGSFSAGSGGRF